MGIASGFQNCSVNAIESIRIFDFVDMNQLKECVEM
jgi:hypothetical protein